MIPDAPTSDPATILTREDAAEGEVYCLQPERELLDGDHAEDVAGDVAGADGTRVAVYHALGQLWSLSSRRTQGRRTEWR